MILFVEVYKYLISPVLPTQCRFYPTCSTYSIKAIKRFGPIKGGWLSMKRVVRCNPFNPGGYDPVPPKEEDSWKRER